MKNTEKTYEIKKHNITRKIRVGSGIFITSLLVLIANANGKELTEENNTKIENFLLECENKTSYDEIYNGIIKLISPEQFDQNFVKAYNEIEYITINNVKYQVNNLYARHVIGGGAKIIKNGDFDLDIIENEYYDDYCDNFVSFKDANFFYKMYKDEKIKEKNIIITTDELKEYLKDWNGKTHTEVPETVAENKTEEFFIRNLKH